MRKHIKILIIFFLANFLSIASYPNTPVHSNEFMYIGVGARALGMSNGFVAVANDVTSGYWNPAGLINIESQLQVSLMHSQYFAGIASYDYGAIAFNTDEYSSFAFSYLRFGVDDIPDTSELIDSEGNINYDRIKSFSAADNGFILSYARMLPRFDNLKVGVNAKVIRRTAGSFASAWGFGVDVGAQYAYNNWLFGFSGKDITTTFNAWNYDLDERMRETFELTGNEIPESSTEITLPRFILGAARSISLYENLSMLMSVDMMITTDGKRNVLIKSDPFSIDPSLGIELNYGDFVFLRGGVGNIQQYHNTKGEKIRSAQPNIGIGVVIQDNLTIDYALTNVGNSSIALYSNIFSLRFNINPRDTSEPRE